jgi:AcrR family transcriptional regulator
MMSRTNITTRNKILESTWQLLEADQGSLVRMTDIAKQAGISRQAVYLHFPTRAELLIATTRYLDDVLDIDKRLEASRNAESGPERMDAFIEAWGNYIPDIYGIAKALIAMQDTDEAAKLAWADRMHAVRQGCKAAARALKQDGVLSPDYSAKKATDILWTLLSVHNWAQLTIDCSWSQKRYIEATKRSARRILIA